MVNRSQVPTGDLLPSLEHGFRWVCQPRVYVTTDCRAVGAHASTEGPFWYETDERGRRLGPDYGRGRIGQSRVNLYLPPPHSDWWRRPWRGWTAEARPLPQGDWCAMLVFLAGHEAQHVWQFGAGAPLTENDADDRGIARMQAWLRGRP